MYTWYENSDICIAYLPDVPDASGEKNYDYRNLRRSEWFRRGWTLQELLAPRSVSFYDAGWRFIGGKQQLKAVIEDITKIDAKFVSENRLIWGECVATKMRWAAGHETTRDEDEAYCLLGLFGVNMPLLYGEGRKAFQRLQREINAHSDDQTILAHRHDRSNWLRGPPLAGSSDDFVLFTPLSPQAPRCFRKYTQLGRHPFSMTNKGLQMKAAIVAPESLLRRTNRITIALDCGFNNSKLPFLLEAETFEGDTLLAIPEPASRWYFKYDENTTSENAMMKEAVAKLQRFILTDDLKKVDLFVYQDVFLG